MQNVLVTSHKLNMTKEQVYEVEDISTETHKFEMQKERTQLCGNGALVFHGTTSKLEAFFTVGISSNEKKSRAYKQYLK